MTSCCRDNDAKIMLPVLNVFALWGVAPSLLSARHFFPLTLLSAQSRLFDAQPLFYPGATRKRR